MEIPLSQCEFQLLSELIYNQCGIVIKDDKKYLITQRLTPILREAGCAGFSDFYQKLQAPDCGPALRLRTVEAITTNETSFFRDDHPFETFRGHILPRLIDWLRKARCLDLQAKIRIWSAAASTGQEPYTLAIIIREHLESAGIKDISAADFKILATDISSEMLAKASAGKFTSFEMSRGMPPGLKLKYFTPDKSGNYWFLRGEVKSMIELKQVNLTKPFSHLGNFELALCRNVLIYFDDRTKISILNQIHAMITPGGHLMLGAMENTYCLTDKFNALKIGKTILYQKL
jgi:chemotaxis protein methyltransferase CheR